MTVERKFIEDAVVKLNMSKYLAKELSRAGFSGVDIQKTPVLTRITVYVMFPGRAIGPGGKTINEITENIKNRFGAQNPQISVVEVQNKMLEPMLVAKDLAEKLERNMNPRRIIQFTIKSIILNGALGAEIILSGKLAAKGARAKTIRKLVGHMPKSGDPVKYVREAKVAAYPKYGAIGIKVRILPAGTILPGSAMKVIEIPKEIMNS
ncbi:MAG: 30S ribosomal protein S3 [Candidatus Marsarchaeota archaeon]|jgi:ribosomal protein S3, eukaryotic/archaeal type|nr:30S ribosomal protein S3 [Candidatus Marsarchaeota archaeon]